MKDSATSTSLYLYRSVAGVSRRTRTPSAYLVERLASSGVIARVVAIGPWPLDVSDLESVRLGTRHGLHLAGPWAPSPSRHHRRVRVHSTARSTTSPRIPARG